jgi:hypothetical protein
MTGHPKVILSGRSGREFRNSPPLSEWLRTLEFSGDKAILLCKIKSGRHPTRVTSRTESSDLVFDNAFAAFWPLGRLIAGLAVWRY